MIVGGREFAWTREQVVMAMRGVEPEPMRKHVVEIGDERFPPKQVLATVTGWQRQSFTTLEAQRVLSKLGFSCHPVGRETGFIDRERDSEHRSDRARLAEAESALSTAMEAIASLRRRVAALERSDRK